MGGRSRVVFMLKIRSRTLVYLQSADCIVTLNHWIYLKLGEPLKIKYSIETTICPNTEYNFVFE